MNLQSAIYVVLFSFRLTIGVRFSLALVSGSMVKESAGREEENSFFSTEAIECKLALLQDCNNNFLSLSIFTF